MDDKTDYKEYLRIIERTRLLYNTSKELGEVVEFKLGNGNGLVKIGGNSQFVKKAVFRELAYDVEQTFNLDLQAVIDAYNKTDDFIDKYESRIKGENFIRQVIRYFYSDEEPDEDVKGLVDKLNSQQVSILILMLMGELPRINSKGGDVDNIKGSYDNLFKLMREIVCQNIPFQVLPGLLIKEEEKRKHSDKMCRIDLIETTDYILNAYGEASTSQRVIWSNKVYKDNSTYPDIEGIWSQDDSSTVFWQFEQLSNGYFLYKWILNADKHEFRYIRFFIRFIRVEDGIWAMVSDPRLIDAIIYRKPYSNDYISYSDFEMDDGIISFKSKTRNSLNLKDCVLKKSKYEDYISKLLTDDTYLKQNEFSEYDYDFNKQLDAITQDYIYVNNLNGGYYKIPKSLDDNLYDVGINDNAGIFRFKNNDNTFLVFDDINLIYDISTPEKMQSLGITIVSDIT